MLFKIGLIFFDYITHNNLSLKKEMHNKYILFYYIQCVHDMRYHLIIVKILFKTDYS